MRALLHLLLFLALLLLLLVLPQVSLISSCTLLRLHMCCCSCRSSCCSCATTGAPIALTCDSDSASAHKVASANRCSWRPDQNRTLNVRLAQCRQRPKMSR